MLNFKGLFTNKILLIKKQKGLILVHLLICLLFLLNQILQQQQQNRRAGPSMQSPTSVCYFCKQQDINQCLTRSLYHKYNDTSTKLLDQIETLLSPSPYSSSSPSPSQKSIPLRKYQQMKHIVDDSEHLTKFYLSNSKTQNQLKQLLEYYKFRKFVPIFRRSEDNVKMTQQLHVYYYDKLKLYYNSIKRKLNITIDPSSGSQTDRSFITKSSMTNQKSQILGEFVSKMSKEQIRQYETESKALENLLNILKKNQDRLKKIKSLRTQDCSTREANPFKDNIQKKNMISYLAPQTRDMMKRGKKIFFRFIQQAKSHIKPMDSMSRLKSNKKIQQTSRASLFYEGIKSRNNSEGVAKIKRQGRTSQQKLGSKNKILNQKSQKKINEHSLQRQKAVIKSLPKVQMNFNIRPSRSLSSASIAHPTNQNHNIQKGSHKVLPSKKQLDFLNNYHTTAKLPQTNQLSNPNSNYNSSSNVNQMNMNMNLIITLAKKKKITAAKTPKKDAEIDQNDNLASINRKKIEQLKIKSQRKKQPRK